MFLRSTVAIARAQLIAIGRSKTALFWIIAFPVGFLLLFGFVMARGDSRVTTIMLPGLLTTTLLSGSLFGLALPLVQQREIGLMGRRSMGDSDGMLFVFEQPGVQCFWMKNTLLPLSIAFIADDGTVVNVADMKPQSLDSHCSSQPVRYALEMNKGWFAKRGVKAGSKLGGEPFGQR